MRAIVVVLAAAMAGCGGAMPSAPSDPGPRRATLILDLDRVTVIEDCDGIEGDGEFEFGGAVAIIDQPIDVFLNDTEVLGPGGTTRVLGRRQYTVDAVDGKTVSVSFTATELDRSIFDVEYSDARLDHANAEIAHVYTRGHWSGLGPQAITLGSDGCRVRLDYTATAG